ncbi:MAG: hypothetical protein WCO56_23955 [Verrucomicrobiota bacterium]
MLNKNPADARPPHAPEVGAGALGCILCAPQPAAAVRLLARLEAGLFYDLCHRRTFSEEGKFGSRLTEAAGMLRWHE